MVSRAFRLISGFGERPVEGAHAASDIVSEACRLALAHMSQGLCVFNARQEVVLANARYAELYGLTPDEVKPGTSLQSIMELRIKKGIYAGGAPDEYRHTRTAPATYISQDEVLSNGRTIHIEHKPLADGGWVATHEDITERKRSEARAAQIAEHDPLTGLSNRLVLRQRLDLALAQALRGYGLALLWINVDHFRCINDYYGLSVGDAVLKEIASRLQKAVNPGDTLVRFGGDEFAIVQVGVNEPAAAAGFARNVLERLCKPYVIGGQNILASVSIGLSLAPADALDAEDLIKNADIALGEAKKEGRKTYRFFQPDMDIAIRSRQRMELDLRQGLASGEFEAIYQPIVDLKSGRVTTVEALVRWRNRHGNLISPSEFILVAEETGLIRPIGAWMLQRACTDALRWPDDVRVAVNLSAAQFRGTKLSDMVAEVLAETGLPARRLELEITETLFYGDSSAVRKELEALKEMGVRIAMDDFGTGYSSLSLLSTFPFDKIKIDRSFIKDIGQKRTSLAILRSITALGLDLDMATTAEGIETREQLEIVRREGCTEVQGFYFSPPVPEANIVASIKACAERLSIHVNRA